MNAMMWVRGFAADYDEWAVRAGPHWSYAEALGYFRRIENVTRRMALCQRRRQRCDRAAAHLPSRQPAAVDSGLAGRHTRSADSLLRDRIPLHRRASARPSSPSAGARGSAPPTPILKPAMRRKNLTVLTEATATRVLIAGPRAVGVEYQHDGQQCVAYARREVVLCGGAVNSPQLLMLSGIGDRDHLAEHGIDTVYHSPEVGQNLLDHLVAPLGFDVDGGSLFACPKAERVDRLPAAAPRHAHLQRRRGVRLRRRSRPELHLPDLELIFVARRPSIDEALVEPRGTRSGVRADPWYCAAESRGQITLRSADPHDKPVIDPRYLSDPAGLDRAAMMEGLRDPRPDRRGSSAEGLLGPIAHRATPPS